jgi:hypothetical protein
MKKKINFTCTPEEAQPNFLKKENRMKEMEN